MTTEGATHARLALHPEELGGITIRLSSTAAGVSARLTADSPDAARVLAGQVDDLRRALERTGVTVGSVEIVHDPAATSTTAGDHPGTGTGPDTAGHGAQPDPHQDPDFDPARPGTTTARRAADATPDTAPDPGVTSRVLPDGALVDVLA